MICELQNMNKLPTSDSVVVNIGIFVSFRLIRRKPMTTPIGVLFWHATTNPDIWKTI